MPALVPAGKPAKIAITAVMRMLVVTANTLLKADRCGQQSIDLKPFTLSRHPAKAGISLLATC